MLPTLTEILELPAFTGARVVSGHAQLTQQVTWVHVCEVLDAHRFVSGGELLLSTGLELARAGSAAREQYVRGLAEAGAHGLALELVRGFTDVPPEVLQAARMFDFPVVTFAQEVRFAALTRAAHERILRPHPPAGTEDGLAQVLMALAETGRGANFVRQHLGPVLALPSRPRATLLATLDALLASHFNVAEVARRLGVRRQTIYYRLEQIRGMLGDLEDPRRHLTLALALELARDGFTDAGLDMVSLERRSSRT